jgi:hypothetical protein
MSLAAITETREPRAPDCGLGRDETRMLEKGAKKTAAKT